MKKTCLVASVAVLLIVGSFFVSTHIAKAFCLPMDSIEGKCKTDDAKKDDSNQSDSSKKLEDQLKKIVEQYKTSTQNQLQQQQAIQTLQNQLNIYTSAVVSLRKQLNDTNPNLTFIAPTKLKVFTVGSQVNLAWRGTNLATSSISVFITPKGNATSSLLLASFVNLGVGTITLPQSVTPGNWDLIITTRDFSYQGSPVTKSSVVTIKVK